MDSQGRPLRPLYARTGARHTVTHSGQFGAASVENAALGALQAALDGALRGRDWRGAAVVLSVVYREFRASPAAVFDATAHLAAVALAGVDGGPAGASVASRTLASRALAVVRLLIDEERSAIAKVELMRLWLARLLRSGLASAALEAADAALTSEPWAGDGPCHAYAGFALLAVHAAGSGGDDGGGEPLPQAASGGTVQREDDRGLFGGALTVDALSSSRRRRRASTIGDRASAPRVGGEAEVAEVSRGRGAAPLDVRLGATVEIDADGFAVPARVARGAVAAKRRRTGGRAGGRGLAADDDGDGSDALAPLERSGDGGGGRSGGLNRREAAPPDDADDDEYAPPSAARSGGGRSESLSVRRRAESSVSRSAATAAATPGLATQGALLATVTPARLPVSPAHSASTAGAARVGPATVRSRRRGDSAASFASSPSSAATTPLQHQVEMRAPGLLRDWPREAAEHLHRAQRAGVRDASVTVARSAALWLTGQRKAAVAVCRTAWRAGLADAALLAGASVSSNDSLPPANDSGGGGGGGSDTAAAASQQRTGGGWLSLLDALALRTAVGGRGATGAPAPGTVAFAAPTTTAHPHPFALPWLCAVLRHSARLYRALAARRRFLTAAGHRGGRVAVAVGGSVGGDGDGGRGGGRETRTASSLSAFDDAVGAGGGAGAGAEAELVSGHPRSSWMRLLRGLDAIATGGGDGDVCRAWAPPAAPAALLSAPPPSLSLLEYAFVLAALVAVERAVGSGGGPGPSSESRGGSGGDGGAAFSRSPADSARRELASLVVRVRRELS